MFIFWKATGVPEDTHARHRARAALVDLPNVKSVAQGVHIKGTFRVTLYYHLLGDEVSPTMEETLRLAVQAQLRRAFNTQGIHVEKDLEAYPKG